MVLTKSSIWVLGYGEHRILCSLYYFLYLKNVFGIFKVLCYDMLKDL